MKVVKEQQLVQTIYNKHTDGEISFKHKLQRPVGQWNSIMRSLLVHSLLQGFPVEDIYIEEQNNVWYTIDGTQRTYELMRYLNNEYALSKSTPDVKLTKTVDGQRVTTTYEIAGKKFSKLDEVLQTKLKNSSLTICFLMEYTVEEMKELFKRLNLSRPLNPKLLRVCIESEETSDAIYALAIHPFMTTVLTGAQKKNGSDRDAIIQTMMLLMSNDENNYTSFRSRDIDAFIIEHDSDVQDLVDTVQAALDMLNGKYDEFIPITTIPMFLWAACRVLNDNKDENVFIDAAINALKSIKDGEPDTEEYRESSKSSTGNQPNVEIRWNWWKKLLETIPTKDTAVTAKDNSNSKGNIADLSDEFDEF